MREDPGEGRSEEGGSWAEGPCWPPAPPFPVRLFAGLGIGLGRNCAAKAEAPLPWAFSTTSATVRKKAGGAGLSSSPPLSASDAHRTPA